MEKKHTVTKKPILGTGGVFKRRLCLQQRSSNLGVTVGSCRDFNHLFAQLKPSLQRGGSSASLHNSTMRNTIFQLMIHTLDPLGDGE